MPLDETMQAVMNIGVYTLLARLLEHPKEDMSRAADECLAALGRSPQYPPAVADAIRKFKEEASKLPLNDLQEMYSYTFELSADYTMDLGYHLFDGFRRANNLLVLKETYKNNGFPFDEVAKGELPDHLTIMLKFFDFTDNQDLVKEMRENMLVKAMEKLVKNFEMTNKDNVYYPVIKAVGLVVDCDVKYADKMDKGGHKA